ncbi:hypothetical protein SAICODRAFT_201301 [Saitoella complicata NRRL Y-17804]|uniref:uncharacterized protein n=1 Tax=Saitoella complicata (strain BCRC 22490 / CBS 7301 / JCM 7358 / NBRC 10748 / NRRL Y-17804) TaxID=698492 RepID=UPI0008678CFA|nr:uncharacterized protein SAICODRAFT_201301 [Saitoella complicata NRRL Y-17804]ODQ54608.1 hypothetical protein SAICODRAFT_201301 [Saitoella complicata NRRL Y-17804]
MDENFDCVICLDHPDVYGISPTCMHVYCFDCILKWRLASRSGASAGKTGHNLTQACPICRMYTNHIIPSIYFIHDDAKKTAIVERFHHTRQTRLCPIFSDSYPYNTLCPLWNECHYQHRGIDGTCYVFSKEEIMDKTRELATERVDQRQLRQSLLQVVEQGHGSFQLLTKNTASERQSGQSPRDHTIVSDLQDVDPLALSESVTLDGETGELTEQWSLCEGRDFDDAMSNFEKVCSDVFSHD